MKRIAIRLMIRYECRNCGQVQIVTYDNPVFLCCRKPKLDAVFASEYLD